MTYNWFKTNASIGQGALKFNNMRKQNITFLALLLFSYTLVYSQTNYLGFSSNTDENSFGIIIEITNGTPQTHYVFTDNGAPPYDNLVEYSGVLYGVTQDFGILNNGTLYAYDLNSGNFDILTHFDDGVSSHPPLTMLCSGNSSIYGIRHNLFSGAIIAKYDIPTQSFSSLVSLNSIGVSLVQDLIYTDNKLYGLSDIASGSNILFSLDLTTNALTNEFTFNSTDGTFCHSIIQHSNGNLYGATTSGGANNQGVIFEFDTTNNTYTKLYDLTSSHKADNLVEVSSNTLYGYINPLTGGGARIYKFDLSTNSFSNEYFFPSGIQPVGNDAWHRDFNLLVYSNNKVYATSQLQSSSEEQLFFEYDIVTNTLTSFTDQKTSTPAFKINSDRIIYGSYAESNGALIEYDPSSQVLSTLNGTDFGTQGREPYEMILASTGIVYGVTLGNDILSN